MHYGRRQNTEQCRSRAADALEYAAVWGIAHPEVSGMRCTGFPELVPAAGPCRWRRGIIVRRRNVGGDALDPCPELTGMLPQNVIAHGPMESDLYQQRTITESRARGKAQEGECFTLDRLDTDGLYAGPGPMSDGRILSSRLAWAIAPPRIPKELYAIIKMFLISSFSQVLVFVARSNVRSAT